MYYVDTPGITKKCLEKDVLMQSKNAEKQAEQERSSDINREIFYKGKILTFYRDSIPQANGLIQNYEIVNHPGAVVMIPIDKKGNIHFVKQWRRAVDKILIELPAGTLEEGELVGDCVQRELQEEIGYMSNQIIPFGGFYTVPGFCTEYLHMFLALDLEKSVLYGDDTEEIDQLVLHPGKLVKMIESGEIEDAKTIIGIFKYFQWKSIN